jgi:hypothetical protein
VPQRLKEETMKSRSVERVGGEGAEAETRPQYLSTIPMKAIVQDGYGAPELVLKLDEVDRPAVGDDDVLIRVRATSVNTPDWVTVAGVPYVTRPKSGL